MLKLWPGASDQAGRSEMAVKVDVLRKCLTQDVLDQVQLALSTLSQRHAIQVRACL